MKYAQFVIILMFPLIILVGFFFFSEEVTNDQIMAQKNKRKRLLMKNRRKNFLRKTETYQNTEINNNAVYFESRLTFETNNEDFKNQSEVSVLQHPPDEYIFPVPSVDMSRSLNRNKGVVFPRREERVRSFYAMGDIPYSGKEIKTLIYHLQELEPKKDGAGFIVHLGDITRDCKLYRFEEVNKVFRKYSPLPVFIIPGDNDWNDCNNPDRAWDRWYENFKYYEQKWGPSFKVRRDNGRKENFSFLYRGVLFIGLNLVGGQILDEKKWNQRLRSNYRWTKRNLKHYYKRKYYNAVVILGHAKRIGNMYDQYFDPLFNLLENDYDDVPFLYLHGDGHVFNKETVKFNLLDVQVDRGKIGPPVLVKIKDSTRTLSRDTFDFDRRK